MTVVIKTSFYSIATVASIFLKESNAISNFRYPHFLFYNLICLTIFDFALLLTNSNYFFFKQIQKSKALISFFLLHS